MLFHRGPLDLSTAARELAVAHALLRRASVGELDEAVRIYRPTGSTVVFGRRDTRLEGFPQAAQVARDAGFEPAVRATGGRAVAYTGQAFVIDHVKHDPHAAGGLDSRFETFGAAFVSAFGDLGIDARIGAVPGEYCPGAHSVNARGVVKLVGTSQRVVRNAWLFSSLVVVDDIEVIRPVLTGVYAHLGQEFDASSVGSLRDEAPGVDAAVVEAGLLALYDGLDAASPLDEATLALAEELEPQHRVDRPLDVDGLRSLLRQDLVAAMKARRKDVVSALRIALAEIDNAEAVAAADDPGARSEHVAGTRVGVGSTEAARRDLSLSDVHALLVAQVADRTTEADGYDALGQHEAASQLRDEAEALRKYLPQT